MRGEVLPSALMILVVVALLGYVGFVTLSTNRGTTVSSPPPAEEPLSSTTVSDDPISIPSLPAEPFRDSAHLDSLTPGPPVPEDPPAAELPPSSQPAAEQIITEEEVTEVEGLDISAPPMVRVRLVTKADAWIQTAVDDNPPDDKIYPPGASVTWEAAEKIELRLGNVGGVALVVNGIPLKPFGKPNQVMRLTFTDTTVSINGGQPQDLKMWQAVE